MSIRRSTEPTHSATGPSRAANHAGKGGVTPRAATTSTPLGTTVDRSAPIRSAIVRETVMTLTSRSAIWS